MFAEHARSRSALDTSILEVLCGPGPHGAWQLARLGGAVLDSTSSLSESRVAEGSTLVLDAPPIPSPEPLWDDSLAGVSAAARSSVWSAGDARRFASAAVGLLSAGLLALAFTALFSGAPMASAGIGAGTAVAALVYMAATRANGASPWTALTGVACANLAVGVAAAALVPGLPGAPHVLAGAGTAVILCVLGSLLASREGQRAELAAFATAGCLASLYAASGAAALWGSIPGASLAVAAGTAGWLVMLAAPTLALALSRFPLPESTAERDATADPFGMDEVRTYEDRIALVLVAGTAGAAVAIAGGAFVLAISPAGPGPWGGAWILAAAAWLLLRVRTVPSRLCGLCCLTAGIVTALALPFAAFLRPESPEWTVAAAGFVVVLVAVVAACGWWVPATGFSPSVRRVVDVLDVLITCAIPPLALCAAGVVEAVRS